MTNKKVCEICGNEFTPKQDWMKICPECFKKRKRNEYYKKVEKNIEEMKLLPLDPLNTISLYFGVYKGCNLFQIFYTDRDYFKYLQSSVSNSKFDDRNKELKEELNNFEKKLYKYIVGECFKRLRKSLSKNKAVYAKGIHAVGIEYGIRGQFYIQEILSNKPILYLYNKRYYDIGVRLQGKIFFNLLKKLHNITDGGYSEYSCYTFF